MKTLELKSTIRPLPRLGVRPQKSNARKDEEKGFSEQNFLSPVRVLPGSPRVKRDFMDISTCNLPFPTKSEQIWSEKDSFKSDVPQQNKLRHHKLSRMDFTVDLIAKTPSVRASVFDLHYRRLETNRQRHATTHCLTWCKLRQMSHTTHREPCHINSVRPSTGILSLNQFSALHIETCSCDFSLPGVPKKSVRSWKGQDRRKTWSNSRGQVSPRTQVPTGVTMREPSSRWLLRPPAEPPNQTKMTRSKIIVVGLPADRTLNSGRSCLGLNLVSYQNPAAGSQPSCQI